MKQKTAVVTGSTKGLGLALSKQLLSVGYKVYLSYSNDDLNASLVEKELSEKYHSNNFCIDKVDLSDYSETSRYIQKLKMETSNIDVLILNATATDRTPFENVKLEDWDRIMRINVSIPFLFVQGLLENMKQGTDKCIIFSGAVLGVQPHALSIAYGVSKAAEHAFAKNLVKFVEPYGIRSNVVAPGFVETEMQKNKPEHIRKNIYAKLAAHRFATVEEIVEAFMFVINNSYVNGAVIAMDGGYSYQ